MSEFIDRLAKVISKRYSHSWRLEFADNKRKHRETVRLILTEMRDAATPEMLQNIERELSSQNQCQRAALDAWQAAIDTALKEGQ